MSVNLIRKNSDTPNIRNYDDTRLFRYINQGKSGIIKNYGDELTMTHGTGNNLHIASGEIIHQGWQVEITSAGVDIELENRDSVEYYSVYLEINLSISSQQKAEIKYLKGNEDYPVIDTGDDLTTTPTGTSRLLIAKVYLVPSSSTFTIQRQIDVLPFEITKVKMDYNNGNGKRYLLTTGNNPVSGNYQTPQYVDWVYLMGDNNGLHIEDIVYVDNLFYLDSDNNLVNLRTKLTKYIHHIKARVTIDVSITGVRSLSGYIYLDVLSNKPDAIEDIYEFISILPSIHCATGTLNITSSSSSSPNYYAQAISIEPDAANDKLYLNAFIFDSGEIMTNIPNRNEITALPSINDTVVEF